MAIVLERNNLVVYQKDVSICTILLVLRRDQFFSGPTLMRLANKFSFLSIVMLYLHWIQMFYFFFQNAAKLKRELTSEQ